MDGYFLDGEGAVSGELITGIESADALAGAEDAGVGGREGAFAFVLPVVFYETL